MWPRRLTVHMVATNTKTMTSISTAVTAEDSEIMAIRDRTLSLSPIIVAFLWHTIHTFQTVCVSLWCRSGAATATALPHRSGAGVAGAGVLGAACPWCSVRLLAAATVAAAGWSLTPMAVFARPLSLLVGKHVDCSTRRDATISRAKSENTRVAASGIRHTAVSWSDKQSRRKYLPVHVNRGFSWRCVKRSIV